VSETKDAMSGETDGAAAPNALRVLTTAQVIFFGLLGVVQFFGDFLEGWVQITATLITTALAAAVTAWMWLWQRARQQTGQDVRPNDRWIALLAIMTIGVVVLDVVAFSAADGGAALPHRICMYDVTGSSAAGAVSYPIEPGGSVTQAFVPEVDTVTAIIVIAGLDDESADLDDPHPLTMHLWSDDRSVDETVMLADLTNNGGTRFDLSHPVDVDTDQTFRYSVRNDSGHDDVGFYLKPVSSGDVGIGEDSSVHIVGHRNMNPDYEAPGWAMSGCVEGMR
jgi:hypothetical protein